MEIEPVQPPIAATALRKMFARFASLATISKSLKTLLITIVHQMSPFRIGVR